MCSSRPTRPTLPTISTTAKAMRRSPANGRSLLLPIAEGKETKEVKQEVIDLTQEDENDQDLIATEEQVADEESEAFSDDETGDFRVAAKHVLITYSKCGDHVAEDLVEHVKEICKNKGWALGSVVGATEKHKDGENHVHLGLKFTKKPNITVSDTFDLPCDCGCGKHLGLITGIPDGAHVPMECGHCYDF